MYFPTLTGCSTSNDSDRLRKQEDEHFFGTDANRIVTNSMVLQALLRIIGIRNKQGDVDLLSLSRLMVYAAWLARMVP